MSRPRASSLDEMLRDHSGTVRRTKVVCTLGPACWSVESLVNLIDAGMNVARLNFSHRTLEYHVQSLQNLREALRARPHKQCAVLMDTKVRSSPPPSHSCETKKYRVLSGGLPQRTGLC